MLERFSGFCMCVCVRERGRDIETSECYVTIPFHAFPADARSFTGRNIRRYSGCGVFTPFPGLA